MSELSVKPLKYKELPGLTEKQLAEHHDVLYAGYVKKVNELRAAFKTADLDKSNGTYAEARELKLEEGFALNAVKLHEAYFDNMTSGGNQPQGTLAEWITTDFGSYEAWVKEASSLGLASRGWVVLAFDLESGKLHNFLCDAHNQGGIWSAVPLMVLDVYEHAYFLDYATGRKKYVEAFMGNLDWTVADKLIHKYDLAKHRQ